MISRVVLVGIAKIERFDSGCGFDRRRQRLRSGRNELHFQRAKFLESFVHVSYDDRNVLKPKIIAAGISGNRPAGRCQILRQVEKFISQAASARSASARRTRLRDVRIRPRELQHPKLFETSALNKIPPRDPCRSPSCQLIRPRSWLSQLRC